MAIQTHYVPPENVHGDGLTLPDDESQHITKVLRKEKGDAFLAADGAGTTYECEIISLLRDRVAARILSKVLGRGEPKFSLTLAVALPKKDKFEWIIEKGTELGVSRFIPLLTARTIVAEKSLKIHRCQKIAISAMKQSGRSRLPVLEPPLALSALLAAPSSGDLRLIAHEKENTRKLDDLLVPARSAILCIGPEGGFTEDEIIAARQRGYGSFGMGCRRLRTETATITAAALVMHKMGELEPQVAEVSQSAE